MTKHEAVLGFFGPKVIELSGGTLSFNYSDSGEGIALVTEYADKVRKKYIRIGAEKEYGFSIVLTKAYSTNSDDLNLEAMNFAQGFMDWLDEQGKAKHYPAFPENCQVKGMECLQNMPNLAGVNSGEGLARYMVQCRIIYFEKEESR